MSGAGDLLERDRAARLAAQRLFDRPLVLEAGAGTGKTTTLIARLLAWALGAGWDKAAKRLSAQQVGASAERIAAAVWKGVVAITFTEAAAAEMAERAARELGRLAGGQEPPEWLDAGVLPGKEERTARTLALLATLDHLTVRTIHAYCLRLLTDAPLEAGVHPELTVDADGLLVEEVVRETVETALATAYGEPGNPNLLWLAARGFGPPEIFDALVTLTATGLPAAALDEDPLRPAAVAALRERLAEACGAVHGLVAPRLAGGRLKNARALAEALAATRERLSRGDPPWEAAQFPENLFDHLKKWTRGLEGTELSLFGEVQGELQAAARRLADLLRHVSEIDPDLLTHARLGLAPLLATVERAQTAKGIASFGFLLSGAERLLATHAEVRRRIRRGIDQLLVDEFQDTDRIQCAIVAWLALDGPSDERPGLFLVGDPKQSIYGWRSADLAAYQGFVARVVAAGGEVLPLSVNFRSVPAILDEVERVARPVMVAEQGLQPPFEPLLACAERQGDPGFDRPGFAPVEHWISWPAGPGPTAGEATQLEAEAVAKELVLLHTEHGVAWREMALLLRSASDLDVYLEPLRLLRVPFVVARDTQYYRRREIIEAAALVRTIVDPGDHLALATVLRSTLVGVPDAALLPLWRHQLPRRLTELRGPSRLRLAALFRAVDRAAGETPRDVPGLGRVAGWERNLKAALARLAELRQSFATDAADVFLEKVRRLTLVEAVEAARYLGPYRLANLERFFRQLLAAIEASQGDASAVLRALRKSVTEAREAEEARPPAGGEDAVPVLTVHGAKGLDFGHVYLLQLHKTSPGDRGPVTEAARRPREETFAYRLFGAPTLDFDRVEAERRAIEAAERVRLLYVAMTRAKDRLVLLGAWPRRPEPRGPGAVRSQLDLLQSRGELPFDLGLAWERRQASFLDPAGVVWKLPALMPQRTATLGAQSERPPLPPPEEVALMATSLAAARGRAAVESARPWSGAASEEAHVQLRELLAEPARRGERPGDRPAALAAGGGVHRALETWNLEAEPEEEARRQRALLPTYLAMIALGDELPRALALAEDLLDHFCRGSLLPGLRSLAGSIVARELPVLVPPQDAAGPVGFVSGAIDLLYRDPETGELVVADHKTDDVDGDELEARAAVYAAQGAVYTRAVAQALGLERRPRFELWFLRAGRVFIPQR